MQKEISICMWIHNWFNFLHVFSPAKAFHDSFLRDHPAKMQGKTDFEGQRIVCFQVIEMPVEHQHF